MSGKKAPPFPIAVSCRTQEEAIEVMQLQPMVSAALNEDPPLSNQGLATRFFQSALVSATLNDGETEFWAVNYGHRIGIFRTWCAAECCMYFVSTNSSPRLGTGGALEQINGCAFQGYKKFMTFRGALVYMISKAEAVNGD
jgi:hypothetical protein